MSTQLEAVLVVQIVGVLRREGWVAAWLEATVAVALDQV